MPFSHTFWEGAKGGGETFFRHLEEREGSEKREGTAMFACLLREKKKGGDFLSSLRMKEGGERKGVQRKEAPTYINHRAEGRKRKRKRPRIYLSFLFDQGGKEGENEVVKKEE